MVWCFVVVSIAFVACRWVNNWWYSSASQIAYATKASFVVPQSLTQKNKIKIRLLSGGKTTPCGLDGMAMKTVKISRNLHLVFDGRLWGVICHTLANFLYGVLRASPPHTCKHPFWLYLAVRSCESWCAPV